MNQLPETDAMITFEVNDMTCGHCASSISKAVGGVDKDARVKVDLETHRVEIESARADAQKLSDAVKEAGYSPSVVANSSAQEVTGVAAKKSGGCCCCG